MSKVWTLIKTIDHRLRNTLKYIRQVLAKDTPNQSKPCSYRQQLKLHLKYLNHLGALHAYHVTFNDSTIINSLTISLIFIVWFLMLFPEPDLKFQGLDSLKWQWKSWQRILHDTP